MFPKWENWTEERLPINPIKNYTWKYRMVKIVSEYPKSLNKSIRLILGAVKDGQEVEKLIDISKWLEDEGSIITIPKYGITPGHYIIYPSATLKRPVSSNKSQKYHLNHCRKIGYAPLTKPSVNSSTLVYHPLLSFLEEIAESSLATPTLNSTEKNPSIRTRK